MALTLPNQTFKVYRLRHKTSGLYSSGGTDPVFGKKGKVWRQLNHVRSHLAQFSPKSYDTYARKRYPTYLDEVEIVEYIVTENESSILPV